MNKKLFHSGRMLIPLLLVVSVLISACSVSSLIPITGAIKAAVTQANLPTQNQNVVGATSTPQVANPQSGSVDCKAVGDAFMDFEGVYPSLGILSSGVSSGPNTPGTPYYIDFTKLRSDFDVLATLPDGAGGKTSDSITKFRQLTDLVENYQNTGVTPTPNSNGDTQNIMNLYAQLSQPYIVVVEAFSSACPNYTMPTMTPAP